MTVLYTTLAIALTIAAIAAHEWGHLDAMRRLGVDVEKFALGFGRAVWSRTLRSGLRIQLGPIPLGAFVAARDALQIDRLSARDNARYSGAGVWVNCALGLALMGLGGLIGAGYRVVPCLATIAAGVALWLLRRWLGPWHLVLGALAIALIVYTELHPLTGPGSSLLSGPIELYKLLVVSNPSDALIHAGAASLTVGLINSLPVPPPRRRTRRRPVPARPRRQARLPLLPARGRRAGARLRRTHAPARPVRRRVRPALPVIHAGAARA